MHKLTYGVYYKKRASSIVFVGMTLEKGLERDALNVSMSTILLTL